MKGQLTIQNFKSYTKEDQKIWSTLFEQNVERLKKNDGKLVKDFIEALAILKIKKGEIPNLENLNKLMKPLTGFELIAITDELEDNIHFQLLKNRKFPVRITLPHIFDDVFGKVPFLIGRFYGDEILAIAVNATANPSMLKEYKVQYNNLLRDSLKINETNP